MIFVDVDDTLVLYLTDGEVVNGKIHPYGEVYGEPWIANEKLIAALVKELMRGIEVCVWSGGGKDYAERWRNTLLPNAQWSSDKSRFVLDRLVPSDICIDDMPLITQARVFTYQKWLEERNVVYGVLLEQSETIYTA